VEVSHTDLTEAEDKESANQPTDLQGHIVQGSHILSRMVLVHVCSVVVGATSQTTTTWVLAVLANTTVTSAH